MLYVKVSVLLVQFLLHVLMKLCEVLSIYANFLLHALFMIIHTVEMD